MDENVQGIAPTGSAKFPLPSVDFIQDIILDVFRNQGKKRPPSGLGNRPQNPSEFLVGRRRNTAWSPSLARFTGLRAIVDDILWAYCLRPHVDVSCFTLAQRAITAFLALSLRSSGVIAAALAGPPFLPPRRPKATAYGFLRLFAMP
jgi:hypothetical protein